MQRFERLDPTWAAQFEETDGVLYRRLFQPERDAVMRDIQAIRNLGTVRDVEPLGRWCLSVPFQDYRELCRTIRWRDLGSKDKATRQAAWRRFLQSPDSAAYRVRERAS